MNVSRLDDRARELVLSSPEDGSQDLYVSTMAGIPQRLVLAVRAALIALYRRTAGPSPWNGGAR